VASAAFSSSSRSMRATKVRSWSLADVWSCTVESPREAL
jgi:hypothetical protein